MIAAHRDAMSSDRAFIVSAWSSSFKASNSAGIIASEDWAGIMHGQLEKLLERRGVRAVVAYERTDPGFLYGFIVGDVSAGVPVVFYTYTKEPYRRTGIARRLFAALGVDPREPFLYACRTPAVTRMTDKIPRARWEPNVARYPKQQENR